MWEEAKLLQPVTWRIPTLNCTEDKIFSICVISIHIFPFSLAHCGPFYYTLLYDKVQFEKEIHEFKVLSANTAQWFVIFRDRISRLWKVTTVAAILSFVTVNNRNMMLMFQKNPPGLWSCMHGIGQRSALLGDVTLHCGLVQHFLLDKPTFFCWSPLDWQLWCVTGLAPFNGATFFSHMTKVVLNVTW